MNKIKEKVYSDFKENFNLTIKWSAIISLSVIVIYFILYIVLSYVPSSELYGIILIFLLVYLLISFIMPFFYSFYACNGVLVSKQNQMGQEMNTTAFLSTRKIGKLPQFRNSTNTYSRLLISYLIYVAIFTISMFFSFLIGYYFKNEEGIYGFINDVNNITDSENFYNILNSLILTYQTSLRKVVAISTFFGVGLAFFYFLHKISRSFINYIFANGNDGRIPQREINATVKEVLKDKSLNYNKEYYSLLWPYYLSGILVYTISYLLMFFLLPNGSILVMSLTSMVLVVFILLPFLPIVLNFNMVKREALLISYFKVINKALDTYLDEAIKSDKLSEKEKAELKEKTDLAQKKFDDLFKEIDKKDKDKEEK